MDTDVTVRTRLIAQPYAVFVRALYTLPVRAILGRCGLTSSVQARARALRSWEPGTSGRWHIHCAIELPLHYDAVALERLVRDCWAKVQCGCGRILVRDGANAGWIHYMLKGRQKSEFDSFIDCIIRESVHNPIVDA